MGCSKHEFFDTSLEMIGTMKRWPLTAFGFSVGPSRNRAALKHHHQFAQDQRSWSVAVQQLQHLKLQRMIGVSVINFERLIFGCALLLQSRLRRLAQQAFQI